MSTHNMKAQNLICGLDIGTTKVAFVIASASSNGLEILGLGQATHMGVRHGVVVNIEATTEAIKKAREEAELMSGLRAEKVWFSVGGTHIQSFDSNGMVAVRNREVTKEDIERVVEAAKAIAIPSDRQVLHVLPKDFKLDGQEGIADPRGMSGVRLEASVHIITGNRAIIQNAVRCVERANLEISGLVLTQLASSLAVLSSDEKNLGVSVIDIGGGTCEIITYLRNSVTHTACIPVGGNNFTHDVALGLRTTQINAEAIKHKEGYALPDMAGDDESIEVESVGGRSPRTVARSSLCRVLEARAEETLKLIQKEIENKGFVGKLGSGIVITGGGAELRGLVEMGDFIFDMPVRLGLPVRAGGLADIVGGASFSTVVGLLNYGYEKERHEIIEREGSFDVSARVSDFGRRLKDFFARAL
ncbi:MAG: cell division protein FtsA [Bdellovibrionales bacterium]|nr:cell division protein FtsA [Bdellovibrionales bacterium]